MQIGNWKVKISYLIGSLALAGVLTALVASADPTCSVGSQCATINTDSAHDITISDNGANGTTTARLYIIGSSTANTYAIKASGTVYSLSGGYKFPDGTVQTTAAANTSSTVLAANVSAGNFGANTGNGNFNFPANLGVGTSTYVSGYKMDAYSAGNGAAFLFGDLGPGGIGIGGYYNSGYIQGYANAAGTAYQNLALNPLGSNVGVGTTTPTSKLHVVTGNVDGVRVESSNSGYLEVGQTGGTRWRWANNYSAGGILELLVGTSGAAPASTVLTVSSTAGYVGIGTGSPSQKLSVAGNIQLTTGGYLYGDTTNPYISLSNAGGSFLAYTSSDYVGVGGGIINFYAGNGEAARIMGKNFSIGTTTTYALFNVGTSTSGLVAQFGGGSGKIDVGTVDPVYTIGGERYATYLPGMTGQKEETTGVLMGGQVIDFNNLEKGSDLWLWSKATDISKHFNQMTVLLTPEFDGNAWYEKDAANLRLTIHGSEAGEISYRLTAPRFDSAAWPNTSNATYTGFNLDNLNIH